MYCVRGVRGENKRIMSNVISKFDYEPVHNQTKIVNKTVKKVDPISKNISIYNNGYTRRTDS